MDNQKSGPSGKPRLWDILKNDVQHKGYIKARHKEWKELQEFYLDDDQRNRLKGMKSVKAWLWKIGWMLKSMFLKLPPFRRVLVVIAVVMIFSTPIISANNHGQEFSLNIPFSSIILIVVIMLELKDKLLARDELEAGRRIQHALMPELQPKVDGWQIMLYTRSANEVGGDLVDFLKIDKGRICISLADISGKGLQAALLMIKLQSIIRALVSSEMPIEKLISYVNDIFHRDTPSSVFASLLYLEIVPGNDELRFINAGHIPPLVHQGTGLQEMPKGELGLGLKAGTQYSERILQMKTDDVFIGCSDGITEARNEAGDFYGFDRFKKFLPSVISLPADLIGKRIIEDVERFVGDASMNDDMSLIILKRG